jgi:glycosyl hydrolase family 115/PA14 domain-containing protein/flagellar associated repeat protein/Big-like domain-containing protein
MKKTLLISCVWLAGSAVLFAQPKQVLFLTTATPTTGDVAVSNRLAQLGFNVTRVTDSLSQSSDANGKHLIVVSSSVTSGNISTKFTASPVPLINGESAIYDELGIDANNVGGATLASQTQINIVDCAHPLAAGLPNGLTTVLTAAGAIVELGGSGTPVASAQIVALATDGRASVFGIEAGAPLNPARIANAPARRVGIFWEAGTFMTANGLKLFDAAVAWAISAPNTPVGITSQPSNVTVDEVFPASFNVGYTGAPPYTVQWMRDDGAGGFTNVPGANCATYTIAQTIPPDSGAMFNAVVNNSFSSATSATATLTVNTDTTPPAMVLAFGGGKPPTSFDLTFSEKVAPGAEDPFNYALDSGVGLINGTLDPDGKTVHFTCDPITNGTVIRVTLPITDRAFTPNVLDFGDPGSSIAIITTDGSIRRHQFNIGGGVLVSDLTNNARFPNSPDVIDFPISFESPFVGDNYGVQIIGYVTAPVSGNYHFYFASDDGGVLYLSTDENPANKRLIAFEPQWAGPREWTGNAGNPPGRNAAAPQNQSRTLFPSGIPLVAGQRYFIEGLMKEATGGDSIAAAWQKPGDPIPVNGSSPIPGLYLSRYDIPATVPGDQPADQVTLEARTVTFAVTATGSPPLTYQWSRDNVAIPGATSSSYTTPLLTTADSGSTFYVEVANPFSTTTSRSALLTVNPDNAGPVLVSASSVHSTDIGLCFDESLDPTTAANAGNYIVNGGAVTVTSATLRYDGKTVQLVLSGPISGSFTVEVNNVLDLTGRNVIIAGSNAGGSVGGLTPVDLGAVGDPAVTGSTFSCRSGEFEILAGGSDIWSTADHGHFAYAGVTGNFDKRVHIARNENTAVSAKAGLMVRESTAAESRNLHAIVMPGPPARNIYETGTRRATTGPTDGWGIAGGANGNLPANHPNSWVRLRRVGHTFSAYVSSNGVDWTQNGASVQTYPEAVLVGLASSSVNNNGPINHALFDNFADTTYAGASVTITQDPADTSVEENHAATFTAAATVSGAPASELAFQWQRDDGAGGYTNIFGASGSTYAPIVTQGDNGAQFRVVAFVPGASATSSAATLAVTIDTTPPRVVSATSSCLNRSEIRVVFSERVDAGDAIDTFNYSIDDGAILMSGIIASADGMSAVITTASPLPENAYHLVMARDIDDIAGNFMAEARTLIDLGLGGRAPVGGTVVVEAENYDSKLAQGGKDWVFSSTPGGTGTFSGAGYMQALPESGIARDEPSHITQAPRLDYCINFPVGGQWRVWLRGNDIVTGGNSVHVGIDNTDSPDPNDNRIGNSGGATGWGDGVWKWTRDANVATVVAWVTVPSPGPHMFSVWMREDSVIVDKILLTTDVNFTFPNNTVIGPAESARGSASPPPPRVSITRSGPTVTISWNTGSVGTLQETDQIGGTWQNTTGATNPYNVEATGAAKFYRVTVP